MIDPSHIRTARHRKPAAHLDDYVCYTALTRDSHLLAHLLQKDDSGTPYPITNYVIFANFSVLHHKFLRVITKVTEPKHYYEAVKDLRWRDAMKVKIQALEKNETWSLQDLPSNKKPISCK